tara:strand:+ start:253 stop:1257 length:1005 start_codon:yes stop_codon:yes gene_type:complete
MTFLVIGSNSFSGSNYVNYLLKSNYKVIGVSRSKNVHTVFLPYLWDNKNKNSLGYKFIFEQIDLNKDLNQLMSLIDKFEPKYIVNFAAQGMVAESWLNPTHWYKTNVLSQVAFHDELRKRDFLKKYVHVTTPEVYGSTDEGWIKENFNFLPSTPYAVSRAACDLHLLSFFKTYNFPVVFTRAANVYGPGQQLYRIIPRTILSCLTGKKLFLHGGGTSLRSFIHIEDVAKATLKISLEANPGNTFHISTNHVISIYELVKKICDLTGADFNKIVEIEDERLGKDKNYLLNSDHIRNCFNWDDKIKLLDGVKDTISWIEKNLDYFSNISWEYHHKI